MLAAPERNCSTTRMDLAEISTFYKPEVSTDDDGLGTVVEYFDEEGNNVTPDPLSVLDDKEVSQVTK